MGHVREAIECFSHQYVLLSLPCSRSKIIYLKEHILEDFFKREILEDNFYMFQKRTVQNVFFRVPFYFMAFQWSTISIPQALHTFYLHETKYSALPTNFTDEKSIHIKFIQLLSGHTKIGTQACLNIFH